MKIEVSNGEIFDKYAILHIKGLHITDPKKLQNIRKEYRSLSILFHRIVAKMFEDDRQVLYNAYLALEEVNKQLWEIEDAIRECEREKDFGEKFIKLARSVYVKNDERSEIKARINDFTNSELTEEKSYAKYV